MIWHRVRLAAAVAAIAAAALLAGVTAGAVTRSDVAYFDGFQDLSGIDATQSNGVALDALGGLRMATNGKAEAVTWDSTADFTAPAAPLRAIVGLSTLDGTTAAGTLRLPSVPLAFRRAAGEPVLAPVAAESVDGYGVGGMSVQRISGDGNKYYMWYAGVPEDRFAQRIYLATSTDGITWTKEPTPVLDLGEPGAFDSRQLTKPSVIYDEDDPTAPFRMWYAAEDETSGGVGYATSQDGRTWTKQGEVLPPGKPGMADSYRVMQPCVVISGDVYYMWYTADDSENRRVAYATSGDGLTWKRGGIVFDVSGGNYSKGAFAPAVVRTETGFHMIFTGNKIVAGGDIQSKLINASSSDGLNWTSGSIVLNTAGTGTAFDGYNMSQPTILSDTTDTIHPYKMWYVGNNPDANGNYHDRIGLAYQDKATSLTNWTRQPGPSGAPYYESVLTLGTQGAAFDTMKVADLRPVAKPAAAGSDLYGFYTGTNAADFVSRIGVKQSSDSGLTWTDAGTHATLIDAGGAGQFDAGGVACPAPLAKDDSTGWWVYHTALTSTGTPSIRLHSVSNDLVASRVDAVVLAPAGTYDTGGQADPSVVRSGSDLVLFYAGKAGATWTIGAATTPATAPQSFSSPRQILTPTPGTYDAGGLRHPVARLAADGSWRLFYTAIGADGVHRIAYATGSADLTGWTKRGLVMDASTTAYDFTEGGVDPAAATGTGAEETLYFTGADRFGWTRAGKATATGSGFVASGAATYEVDAGTARDWRRIVWMPATTPAGTTREVWVSYYPTLSGGWSDFYRVDRDTDLPFQLTVQKMRWQVRMTSESAAATPTLEQLTVNHAPVQFPTSATAVTVPIGPIDGKYVLSWGDLILSSDVPANTSLKVSVRDDAGATVIPPDAYIVANGLTTIPLAGVAMPGSKLVAVLDFTSNATATTPPIVSAKVKSLTATYQTTSTPSQLTLTAVKTVLAPGGSTTLSGTLVSDPTPQDAANGDALPLGGQEVTISQCPAGTTGYTEIGKVTTDPVTGAFTVPTPIKPTVTTSYRATWAGGTILTVTYPPAVGTVRVQVKPKVTLTLTKYSGRSGKYFVYKLGRSVYAKGAVTPNHAKLGDGTTAGTVTVTAYQYKSRKWVKVKSAVRTLSTASAYTWSWRPRYKGTYRWATTFAGDVDHAASASPYRYVKVN